MDDYLKDLTDRLSRWNVVTGLAFLLVGVVMVFAANALAERFCKKIEPVELRRERQAWVRTMFQIVGFVLSVVGFVLCMMHPF